MDNVFVASLSSSSVLIISLSIFIRSHTHNCRSSYIQIKLYGVPYGALKGQCSLATEQFYPLFSWSPTTIKEAP